MKTFCVDTGGSHIIRALLNDLAIDYAKKKGWRISPMCDANLSEGTSRIYPYLCIGIGDSPSSNINVLHDAMPTIGYKLISLAEAIVFFKTFPPEYIRVTIEGNFIKVTKNAVAISNGEDEVVLSLGAFDRVKEQVSFAMKKLSEWPEI